MLDLARHIVNQKAGHFAPDKFEDQYETALIDLINQKRAGKPITANALPRGENVVDLMDALCKSIGGTESAKESRPAKKPRKVVSSQKAMLMPITGKKTGERVCGEEAGCQTAAEVGLGDREASRDSPSARACRDLDKFSRICDPGRRQGASLERDRQSRLR